jgi:hypothetical protein
METIGYTHLNLVLASIIVVITVMGMAWGVGKWTAYQKIKSYKEKVGVMTKEKCLTMQEDCPQIQLFTDKVDTIISAFELFKQERKTQILLWETSASNIATIAGCFRDITIYMLKKADQEGQDLMMDIIEKVAGMRRKSADKNNQD